MRVLEPRIEARLDRCLRLSYGERSCSLCRDVCRYSAIELLPGGIAIDPERCVYCGECFSVCPVSALDPGVDRLIESMSGGETLVISCRESPREVPERGQDLLRTCINTLRIDQYLALLELYKRIIVDARCEGCPVRGRGLETLDRFLEKIRSSEDLGARVVVLRGDRVGEIRTETTRLQIGRRRAIEYILNTVSSGIRLATPLEMIPVIRGVLYDARENSIGDKRHIERPRTRISTRLRALELVERNNIRVEVRGPRVDIEKCILCRICEHVCPTEAIYIDVSRGIFGIAYYKCLECLVCIEKCPVKALRESIEDLREVSVHLVDTVRCDKCGHVYPRRLGRCPLCSAIDDLVSDYMKSLATETRLYKDTTGSSHQVP